jgi:hypothetical protein
MSLLLSRVEIDAMSLRVRHHSVKSGVDGRAVLLLQ